MAIDTIRIRGARTHNLKNIDLDLPREKLIVITGLSGSGKSSLAFDTIYAEGQRRYVESLSAYARQFLSIMEKPDVDHIEGLSPAISIEQKSTSHNPRSTVGTITEIYDYLRLLFARVGMPRCPDHGFPLEAQTVSQMVDQVLALANDPKTSEQRYMLLAPVIRERKGEHAQVFDQLRAQGYVRVRVDGVLYEIDAVPPLALRVKHTIEAVIDRFKVREDIKQRLAESFETALKLGDGMAIVQSLDDADAAPLLFSSKYSCPVCDYSLPELEPRLFSFNSPVGACPSCDGLGVSAVLRSGARRRASGTVAVGRRRARLGPAQRVLLPADRIAGEALWLPRRHALERAAEERATGRAVRQRQGRDRVQLPHRGGRAHAAQAQVRRHRAEPRPPLPRNRIGRRARGTRQIHQRASLPRLRRRAPQPFRAQCVRRRSRTAVDRGAADRRDAGVLRHAHAARLARRDRDQDRQGNPRPPEVPGRRRPRLPHARTQGRHACPAAKRSASGWPRRSARAWSA